jgi:hypothetical protein
MQLERRGLRIVGATHLLARLKRRGNKGHTSSEAVQLGNEDRGSGARRELQGPQEARPGVIAARLDLVDLLDNAAPYGLHKRSARVLLSLKAEA